MMWYDKSHHVSTRPSAQLFVTFGERTPQITLCDEISLSFRNFSWLSGTGFALRFAYFLRIELSLSVKRRFGH